MKISEAIEYLNQGNTLADLAKRLSVKKEIILEEKLNRAAVYFNEKTLQWEYFGQHPEKSLSRDIMSRIDEIQVDKPFVRKRNELKETTEDVLFNVFKDYQKVGWHDFNARKTIFFQEDFYEELKDYSTQNKLKLNVFITILIMKGLEAYKIK